MLQAYFETETIYNKNSYDKCRTKLMNLPDITEVISRELNLISSHEDGTRNSVRTLGTFI